METLIAPAASRIPPQSASRILVVDDDDTIRRLMRRILEGHGCKVLTASDGAAALGVIGSAMMRSDTLVDLVLTDMDMPGINGYALGRQLALRWPTLPVIYMSGMTYPLAGRARLGSLERFIEKPFSAGDLLLILDLMLSQAALERQETQ